MIAVLGVQTHRFVTLLDYIDNQDNQFALNQSI